MAGKPKVTLVATAADGTEIEIRTTTASYEWAGIARQDGVWTVLAKGRSYGSVAARTQAAWRRAGGWNDDYTNAWTVVELAVRRFDLVDRLKAALASAAKDAES